MARAKWRPEAFEDLVRLDAWRERIDLPPIAPALVSAIEDYFSRQDFSFYRPGSVVHLRGFETSVLRILIRVRKSEPYSVFYIPGEDTAEILRIRHPRQKPLS